MPEHLTIRVAAAPTPLLANLQRIAARAMAARGWPQPVWVAAGSEAAAALELALRPGPPPQAFALESGPDGLVRIAASDERGLLYGLGKYLRRSAGPGGAFVPCAWRGVAVPRVSLRGMYFASHFHNYYQEAPLADVEAYIEDLALWGLNALTVWFDLHHFRGLDDPAAQAMLARLKALLRAARGVGMSAGIGVLANEGYATTPAALRATKTGRAHYGVEVCVGTPAGMALVLDNLRAEFEAFRDVGLDHVWLWPYDQGGCACPACAPWGSNGMLRIGEPIARLFRELYPQGQVIYSTWLFDYGREQDEWAGLARAFGGARERGRPARSTAPDWVDYLLADSHARFPRFPLDRGVPGGLPLLNFPEISMWGMMPYGGFGANPLLRRFAALWGEVAHVADGGFPYSEGIFEDLNKIAYAHFYWTGQNDVREALAEYAAFEWGGMAADVAARVTDGLEANHGQCWMTDETLRLWGSPKGTIPVAGYPGWSRYPLPQTADAARAREIYALCEAAEAAMPAWARQAWRWRIIKLRALLDRELISNGGAPRAAAVDGADARAGGSDVCADAFRELEAIFHAAAGEAVVSPPVPARPRRDTSSS